MSETKVNPDKVRDLKVRKADLESFYELLASRSGLIDAVKAMEDRIKAVPNGFRDIKCAIKMLEKLIDALLETFPAEKRITLLKNMRSIRYKIYCGPMATKDPDMAYIQVDDLDELCDRAHECCKLCLHANRCNTCALGKAFDRSLLYERRGGSWQDVDVARLDEMGV